MPELKRTTSMTIIVLVVLTFFALGLFAGFWIDGNIGGLPSVETEFKNPDGPPRIKGPMTPPPNP